MRETETSPPATRWLQYAIALLLVGVAIVVTLVLGGVFDPQPVGSVRTDQSPGPVTIPAGGRQITWLPDTALTPPYTLQLTAQHTEGESDIGFGLVTGNADHYLVVAVSPLGYVSVWEEAGEDQIIHLPWQTWPHVRPGAAENEIWLDNDGQQVTVRLNRELLWRGKATRGDGQVGLYGESFGEPAGLNFSLLSIWSGE